MKAASPGFVLLLNVLQVELYPTVPFVKATTFFFQTGDLRIISTCYSISFLGSNSYIVVFELIQALRPSYTPLLMFPTDCFVRTRKKGCSFEWYALIDIADERQCYLQNANRDGYMD